MRGALTGSVTAFVVTMTAALASGDNQEVAERIANKLRDSGQLSQYQIGVKVQEGTAWLKGSVQSQDQMNAALRLVFETPGVTRVVNDLKLDRPKPAVVSLEPKDTTLQVFSKGGRQRQGQGQSIGQAQRVPSTFGLGGVERVSATEHQGGSTRHLSAIPRVSPGSGAAPRGRPVPVAYTQPVGPMPGMGTPGAPLPTYVPGIGGGVAPARYDQPHLPNYSWPSYAAYPNYAALTYPRQYSPTAWPFIGPFYPYPQVPLGWRKVTLEWDDGWWMLDFKDR